MSAENKANRKRHVDAEMRALHDLSKEELVTKIVRLQESLAQAQKLQECPSGEELERKRRRITLDGQQQHVSQNKDGVRGPEEEKHENERTVEYITDLPAALLGHALQYLNFKETRFFFACGNSALWERRIEYDSLMTTNLVLPARPPYAFLHDNFINVHSLDLGPWCSNVVLAYMCDERVLPKLEHLAMARSIDVTDEGLALLPTNPVRRRKLKSLDLQFCRRLSLEQTLDVRKGLDAVEVVRRQPPWLDGISFFDGDSAYIKSWADGSFACWDADGKINWCGYMRDSYESNGLENWVVTKMQTLFNGEIDVPPQRMWEFYAFRQGCTFLQVSDGHVLEASPKKGLYPPNGFPRAEHANSVPVGDEKFFDEHGDECDEGYPGAIVRVEKYLLQPLDVLMPPPEVVELCHTQLNDMRRVMAERDQEQDERYVNLHSGGDENDEPPREWFQYYPHR